MGSTKKFSNISLALIAVLIFTAVFNVVISGTFPTTPSVDVQESATVSKGGLQRADVNMDSVREQYLKYQTVDKATASFDGLRWAIVEFDGATLYDSFLKSTRYTDFSEYASSVEGKKAEAAIKAQHSSFVSKLNKRGISYVFKYNYTALNNAIAIKVDANAFNAISKMDGVANIYCSEHYDTPKYTKVENDANVYSTGIYDTKELAEYDSDGDGIADKSYQGQGMAVAILDTGLDRTHEAFDPDAYRQMLEDNDALDSVHYDKDAIRKFFDDSDNLNAEKRGFGADDVYYNLKVPFAFDYSDDDADVFPAYNSHGTHVAGIVAGKSDYIVGEGADGAMGTSDDETFTGVAPLAQLVICKVFTDDLFDIARGGADGIDILAALEDCATIGVDVINMSLGSSAGFSSEQYDVATSNTYNRLRSLGISLVCAASNDYSSGYGGGNGTNLASNPDSGTVGSPSTYNSALSVASINGQKSKYLQGNGDADQVAFITNAADGDGNRIEFIDALHEYLEKTYGQAAADEGADLRDGVVFAKGAREDLRLKYVLIGGVGRNQNYNTAVRRELRSRTLNGEPVDGVIALVKRGDTTFAEKLQLAMDSGADACIIYNNVSGTINMSLGEVEDPIPTCLITMDASIPFVETAQSNGNIGFIDVSYSFEAGPFMSDFSSWGPVSDLTLKPEITAHGGEITSAVPGAYDIYSGTSMASPNMAGAVAILRQYLTETTTLTGRELNARINQILMSTATIANNEEGNPYSPRKQGAGLAGIANAIKSEGYITVRPNETLYGKDSPDESAGDSITQDGWLDKTKIELLDDPDREGVYTLEFTVHNTTKSPQSYTAKTFVMTETIASDGRTVAEKSYSLADMSTIEFFTVNGEAATAIASNGDTATESIIVPAEGMTTVRIVITLGSEARDYLDYNFKNGMYVEGFVSLKNDAAGGVTLGVPYLAFYGDWTDAPLFDYDVYELAESEKDTSIDFENKLQATASPTQIIGMYQNDQYILPMGTYLYEMEESEDEIYPERDKVAVSMYDEEGRYTVYEIYAVYAGLLRNAAKVTTEFTNVATGEVTYRETLNYVSKSYSAGGQNRGAFVRMEINPSEWGWKNNETYNVKVEGWLDYRDENGELVQSKAKDDEPQTAWTDVRNTFEFPLTIDYEAPQILDYNIRFDPYEEYGQTKYRVYLDLEVYDNQYVMAVLPCYLKTHETGKTGDFLTLLTEYPVPVYGEKGTSNLVSIEITDYYEQYGLEGNLFVQVEDYAMNGDVYTITLDDESLTYPQEGIQFFSDSKLHQKQVDGQLQYGVNEAVGDSNSDLYPRTYPIYELTLTPGELYQLSTGLDSSVYKNLQWIGESDLVKANENQIYGIARDPNGRITSLQLVGEIYDSAFADMRPIAYAQIDVTVARGRDSGVPSPNRLYFKPIQTGTDYVVNLDNFVSVEVNPNSDIQLEPYISPWYFEAAYEHAYGKKFEFTWKSSDDEVATVDESTGLVRTIVKGNATITAEAADPAYSMILSKSIELAVGEDYYVNNYTLYEYYGHGKVELPSDVNVFYIDEDCFKNNPYITEVVLPSMLTEIPQGAFENCPNLEKVKINSQCTTIGVGAFEGCTSLTTIEFEEYIDANKDPLNGTISDPDKKYYGSITVGHYAFAGTPVREFIHPERMTIMYDGAFEGCTELEEIDLTELRSVGSHVFAGCEKLSVVKTSPSTAIGPYMFAPYTVVEGQTQRKLTCSALTEFVYKGTRLPEYAFYRCENLASFTFESDELISIGERALANTAIGTLSLPGGTYTVGQGAFESCENLTRVTMQDSTNLVLASGSPFVGCTSLTGYDIEGEGSYLMDSDGALYNADKTTLVSLPNSVESYELPASVTTIADGALSGSVLTSIDLSHVTKIGKYAFAMSALTSVTLPDGCEEIPEGAFLGCADLASVGGTVDVKTVGAHAFEYCYKLSSVTLPAATDIGERAFNFIEGINAYGDAQVATNRLAAVNAPKAVNIGRYAFSGSRLTNVTFNNAATMEAYAFAYMPSLKTATFGGVEEVGEYAFFKSDALESVSFAEGTRKIGNCAFGTYDPLSAPNVGSLTPAQYYIYQYYLIIPRQTTLTRVTLPDTVTEIGDYAFAGQAGIREIELGGVQKIGNGAFRNCAQLTGVDLSSAIEIGDHAFNETALNEAVLPNATRIGAYAFAGRYAAVDTLLPYLGMNQDLGILGYPSVDLEVARSREISGGSLQTVEIPSAKLIGDFAFAGNKLQSVSLPASLTSETYNQEKELYIYTENIYDKKGRIERSRLRIRPAIGTGVFAYNPQLTAINVDETNPAYTSIDGVLYEKVANGLILVQFPTGKSGDENRSYTVANGTLSIADSAFEGATGVLEIVLPYSVKSIGSAAFFKASVKHFVFNSVNAPTLIAAYDPYSLELYKNFFAYFYLVSIGDFPWSADPDDPRSIRLDLDNVYITAYYSNFTTYVFEHGFGQIFFALEFEGLGIAVPTATVPLNGSGYDTALWTSFFNEITLSDEVMLDDNAHAAQDAIAAISVTPEQIAALGAAKDKTALALDGEIAKQIAAARAAYNSVTDPVQIELIEESYNTLLAIEAAMRSARKEAEIVVTLVSVEIKSYPTKTRYRVGETFDPAGMQLRVVYSDGSELLIEGGNIGFNKTVIEQGDDSITVYYHDEFTGADWSQRMPLNVESSSVTPGGPGGETDPSNPSGGEGSIGGGNGNAWIYGLIAAGVLLILSAVVIVIVVAKQKQGHDDGQDQGGSDENGSDGEGSEKSGSDESSDESGPTQGGSDESQELPVEKGEEAQSEGGEAPQGEEAQSEAPEKEQPKYVSPEDYAYIDDGYQVNYKRAGRRSVFEVDDEE